MKLQLRKPRILLETKLRVISDYQANITYPEIARRNHISERSAKRIIASAMKEEAK